MKDTKNKIQHETEKYLSPRTEAVKIKGKLFYSEGEQSWNIIRLKKDVLKEFPQLKEKREKFGYTLVISRTKEDVEKTLAEIGDSAIPILLFFNKDEKD